ncbi:MAG: DUF2177 family protein [Marmoricola sp.]
MTAATASTTPWTGQLKDFLGQYAVAAVIFSAVDAVWLTLIAPKLYDNLLGDLLAQEPRVGAAVAFYALFVAGLVHFVVRPALAAGSRRQAMLAGGFFGLVTYATWDLTSLAVLAGFPALLVPIDLAWGTVLSAGVSVATYAAVEKLRSRNTARLEP